MTWKEKKMSVRRERELVTLRLEYSALYQMHLRLAINAVGMADKERARHADLAHAYEVGLNMIELYLDRE